MRTVTIWSDGSYRREIDRGGYAALLYCDGNAKLHFGEEYNTTVNRMELKAAIDSLKLLTEPCKVQIYSDSQYLVNGIQKWLSNWKKRNWISSSGQPVQNQDLWQEMDRLMSYHQIQARWVKGHSRKNDLNSDSNRFVDHFAYNGAHSTEEHYYQPNSIIPVITTTSQLREESSQEQPVRQRRERRPRRKRKPREPRTR